MVTIPITMQTGIQPPFIIQLPMFDSAFPIQAIILFPPSLSGFAVAIRHIFGESKNIVCGNIVIKT